MAQCLRDHGHGVCRELARARAGSGNTNAFHLIQVVPGTCTGHDAAYAFEDVLNRNVLSPPAAGQRAAAVHEHGGDIQTNHRHHDTWQGLVAAGEADQRVVHVTANDGFNAVRNDLSGDQRKMHALVAH